MRPLKQAIQTVKKEFKGDIRTIQRLNHSLLMGDDVDIKKLKPKISRAVEKQFKENIQAFREQKAARPNRLSKVRPEANRKP